jgi:hypothetical protein
MKNSITLMMLIAAGNLSYAQNKSIGNSASPKKHLYMDVHTLEPGKVKFEDVAAAHQKDLTTEGKYGVSFIKYWVDEKNGLVYCLSSSPDSASIAQTHAEAHGLMPSRVYEVISGEETPNIKPEHLFLDVHYLGAGKVTAADVKAAHQKDLATEGKHNVSFINYWVDEKEGVVMCLSQSNDEQSVIQTHTEAHGLIPASVASVKEGK